MARTQAFRASQKVPIQPGTAARIRSGWRRSLRTRGNSSSSLSAPGPERFALVALGAFCAEEDERDMAANGLLGDMSEVGSGDIGLSG